jgi:DNA processing protein
MITAKSALDQNREVFVIPHPVGHPNAPGCNSLIKRGMGKLVQNVEDILTEIKVHIEQGDAISKAKKVNRNIEKRWKSLELDEFSQRICESLEEQDLHIDHLAEQLQVSTHELMPKLLELEMEGAIRQTAGKNFELL